MYVNVSGWNKTHGAYSCDIYMDEKKQDYELHYSDGSVDYQITPFEHVTADWNNDGDVYAQFGAWFSENKNGPGHFLTPEILVTELIASMDPNCRHYGKHIVEIPGVTVPLPDKRPRLEVHIRQSENRALHQEIAKNRKMDILGVRPSGEPWAR